MSIDEIIHRIVRAHLAVILACVAIPVLVVLVIGLATPDTWDARVRLQTTGSTPVSSTEADGLSSRVMALATTPAVVRDVLDRVGADRDPNDFALHHVVVRRLGSSSVVELSVTDHDRAAATKIVQGLTTRVTHFINTADRNSADAILSQVDKDIATATKERDAIEKELFATDDPTTRLDLRDLLSGSQARIIGLRTERSTLMTADAARDTAVAVDLDSPAVVQQPSGLLPRLVLSVILGLLVGLAAAVTIEALRPRIGGIRVLARALEAPLLGNTAERVAALANSLTFAAHRKGVETIVLLGADDRDEKTINHILDELPRQWAVDSEAGVTAEVRDLATAPDGPREEERADGWRPPSIAAGGVRFTNTHGVTSAEEVTSGVVVVSSGSALRRDLDRLDDKLRALRWPLVGVVENVSRHGKTWSL